MIGWPSAACMGSSRIRAIAPVDPPAGNGTTMVIGRFGNDCACAPAIPPSAVRTAATTNLTMLRLQQQIRSLRANVGGLDDWPPFLDLSLVEGGEPLRSLLLAR